MNKCLLCGADEACPNPYECKFAPRDAEVGEDNRPWEWKLTPVKYDLEFVQKPVIRDPQTGERAGIQYFSGFERARASDDCPLCTLKGPPAHGKEELQALRKMISFLESKLGVSSRPAIVEECAKVRELSK